MVQLSGLENSVLEKVGTLAIIRRYPVKSMSGEDMESADVLLTGLDGDRVYAFVDQRRAKTKPDFPWLTARELSSMLLLNPEFHKEGAYSVSVLFPDNRRLEITDPRLIDYLQTASSRSLSQPRSLELVFSPKGNYDSHPISLFGLQTVKALAAETNLINLNPHRFRANFYVSWDNMRPFFENDLVGRVLQIGSQVKIRVDEKDTRCAMINIDPLSGKSTPSILRTVVQNHGNCAGVYATVLQSGNVTVNDRVYLQPLTKPS